MPPKKKIKKKTKEAVEEPIKAAEETLSVEEKSAEDESIGEEQPWVKDIGDSDLIGNSEFTFCIGILVEADPDYYGLVEMFNEAAAEGNRWKIKVISKERIKSVVHSAIRSDKNEAFRKLCKEIVRYAGYNLDKMRGLPTSLLTYFVLYELRYMKHLQFHTVSQREEEKEARIKRFHNALEYSVAKVIKTTKSKTQLGESPEKETYGRRRPESELSTRWEERDFKCIDDFPLKGFDVYVVITNVYDPDLLLDLIVRMGVQVHCVIKVGPPDKEEGTNSDEEKFNSEYYNKIFKGIKEEYYKKKCSKRKFFNCMQMDEEKENEIKRFWNGFIRDIRNPSSKRLLASTIRGQYTPSVRSVDFENENWQCRLKRLLYEEISYSMYNQFELDLLYKKYISSMKGIQLECSDKLGLEEMEVYNSILGNIPNESINIPVIFDCVVAQLSSLFGEDTGYEQILIDEENSIEEEYFKKQDNFSIKMQELNLLHDISTEEEDKPAVDLKPRTVLYRDEIRRRTYHLGNLGKLVNEKTYRLLILRYKKLFDNVEKTENFKKIYRKHMHIFSKAVGIRDRKKVSELLIILGIIDRDPLESKLTATAKENSAKKVQASECQIRGDCETSRNFRKDNSKPEENKYSTSSKNEDSIFNRYLIEDLLSKVNKNNNHKNDDHRLMQNLNSFEEMNPEVMTQAIFNATFKHNSCDTIYVPLLDGFLFKFYDCPKNIRDKRVIPSMITLRDFVMYSLPEEEEWAQLKLKDIRKGYDTTKSLKAITDGINNLIDLPSYESDPLSDETTSEEEEESEEESDSNSEEESDSNSKEESDSSSEEESDSSSEEESDSNSKEDESEGGSDPLSEEEQPNHNNDNKHEDENEKASFNKDSINIESLSRIYNIDPGERLQFDRGVVEAVFMHGTKVKIHTHQPLHHEKIFSLELSTCGHRLYYSRVLNGEEDSIKLLIKHKDGINLSFREVERKRVTGTYYEERKHHQRIFDKGKRNRSEQMKANSSAINEAELLERGRQIRMSENPLIKTHVQFCLSASWPTGGLIECDPEQLPGDRTVYYIRQKYLNKGTHCELLAGEKCRLHLPDNSLIKFMNNGRFIRLFPTGKSMFCSKFIYVSDDVEIEPKEIKPLHYKIFHPEGKVETTLHGNKVSEERLDIRYRTDPSRDYKIGEMGDGTVLMWKSDCSHVVEFLDGTRFTSTVSVAPDDVFCDWDEDEKIKWFRGFSDFKQTCFGSRLLHEFPKFDIENEGFVDVNMSVVTEHPNLASICKCQGAGTTIIGFPTGTLLNLYDGGGFDVEIADTTNISIDGDRFVIDKFLNNSLFQHSVIMPDALKFDQSTNPPVIFFLTSDIYGNEMKIDSTQYIYYRYALSQENRISLKHLTDNVNFFFLRRDLSGMEIFPQSRLTLAEEKTKKIEGFCIQEFLNTPFKDTILIIPDGTVMDQWLMSDSKPIIPVHNEPSTYGDWWGFPFTKKDLPYTNTPPKALLMRVFKTFICKDIHKKLKEIIEDYKRRIDHKELSPVCKCSKFQPWEDTSDAGVATLLYSYGNVIIKEPDESFCNYIREHVVIHAARVASLEFVESRAKSRFTRQKSAIIKKEKVPPYFSSCFGITYFVSKELRDKTNRVTRQKEYTVLICSLLLKEIWDGAKRTIEENAVRIRDLAAKVRAEASVAKECAAAIGRLMAQEIRGSVDKMIREREYAVILDALLNKPLAQVSDADLERITFLLKISGGKESLLKRS